MIAVDVPIGVLAERIGADPSRADALTETLDEATAIVSRIVGDVAVPTPVLRRAIIDTAADLWNARSAPNGVATFADANGTVPLRVSRDRSATARALLRPWLPPVIA